jgi:hypothetical protein
MIVTWSARALHNPGCGRQHESPRATGLTDDARACHGDEPAKAGGREKGLLHCSCSRFFRHVVLCFALIMGKREHQVSGRGNKK